MDIDIFKDRRKSFIEPGNNYFWTATIHNWLPLLEKENYKDVIINSLTYLSKNGFIDVFAFVIMPNHIHLIWRINKINGKETPRGPFLKYTAHEFKKMVKKDNDCKMLNFAVDANNKKFEFWQRDSLTIQLFTEEVAYQKLDYLHFNPCTEYWQLASEPSEYFFSSARFY